MLAETESTPRQTQTPPQQHLTSTTPPHHRQNRTPPEQPPEIRDSSITKTLAPPLEIAHHTHIQGLKPPLLAKPHQNCRAARKPPDLHRQSSKEPTPLQPVERTKSTSTAKSTTKTPPLRITTTKIPPENHESIKPPDPHNHCRKVSKSKPKTTTTSVVVPIDPNLKPERNESRRVGTHQNELHRYRSRQGWCGGRRPLLAPPPMEVTW
jgi:hypothetical protein